MTPDALIAEIRRLAGNIDGTPDAKYDEFDFAADVLELLRKEYGCAACGADISDSRGGNYLGKKYHLGCLPEDLAFCQECDRIEERRRFQDGKCEACACRMTTETKSTNALG